TAQGRRGEHGADPERSRRTSVDPRGEQVLLGRGEQAAAVHEGDAGEVSAAPERLHLRRVPLPVRASGQPVSPELVGPVEDLVEQGAGGVRELRHRIDSNYGENRAALTLPELFAPTF